MIFLAVLSTARCVQAQEDPFGAAPKAAGDAAAAKAPVITEEAKPDPLAIQLLRASNPRTPRELVQAAQAAVQYGRPDEAKRYLAKLQADKPSDEQIAGLAAPYASFLLQLDSNKDLQPEGKQVAEHIYAAAAKVLQSSERIAQAIKQLSDARPGAQQEALDKLAAAGEQVANPMLSALADSTRQAEHRNIRNALVALGDATERPLLGALESDNDDLKKQVISILARTGSSRAVPFLMRPAVDPSAPPELQQLAAAALQRITGARPDLYEARKFLQREIAHRMNGDLFEEPDADDRVRLWLWNRPAQLVEPAVLPRRDAGWLLAARLATDLYAIQPRDTSALRLMLLTHLEWAKTVSGLDKPLPMGDGTAAAMAQSAGPNVVNVVLADALHGGHTAAAIAAAETLAKIGNRRLLDAPAGELAPLAEATTFPDPRVRLAASLAAVRIADGHSYPGAGRMADALARSIETSGNDIVLVGHPRGEDAQSLVGFMNVLGYQGEAAYVGRDFARRAIMNPDYPFLLIADSIDGPPVLELVQWLRRDYRTAHQPIGVMARGERLEAMRDLFKDDAYTTVFPRLHSEDVAAIEVDKLKAIAGRNLISPGERQSQAKAAIAALTELAKNRLTFLQYDLMRYEAAVIHALQNPALANEAAALLALYGTANSQAALAEIAQRPQAAQ